MLFRKGRLTLPAQHSRLAYMEDIIDSLGLAILPLTPSIAAIAHQAALITADEKLQVTPGLRYIW